MLYSDLINKAESHFSVEKPFVIYRKPKENIVIGVFQNNNILHYVNDFTKKGFVFAPFNDEKQTVLIQVDEKLVADFDADNEGVKATKEQKINTIQKQFHVDLVEKGIKEIQKGSFKKVVLSRRLEVATEKSSFELFEALLNTYSNAFCYLWYHPKVGLWLGATPEILLRSENTQLKTMSLAGTKKYIENKEPVWGLKEIEEQELVTQYIANALEEEVNRLKISETVSVRAGNVWHLRTSVSGIMQTKNLNSIIKALHPTPAVCGLPKLVAKDFILENENYDREYYTGFLGELNFKEENFRDSNRKNRENQVYKSIKNTSSLYVNLRCMQLKEDKACIYVGGGITSESVPEKEWEETVVKSNTMLNVVLS
ncbi:chorismate-binding protein [Cellulophaga baltica]|uniref:chorismate-binding protein n=1 Tax=Cellulophaga TaxID=104264 RepID=UPI001C07C649|nr:MULTISPECIES: chorismate-binding protein [Cellulophaga]MBU2996096.1 chorismate-binding protein [Cellulophaga baltica]MDO6767491.1 chorismate-binding protein [Cellulophaga sp. 1_MG-2023]